MSNTDPKLEGVTRKLSGLCPESEQHTAFAYFEGDDNFHTEKVCVDNGEVDVNLRIWGHGRG